MCFISSGFYFRPLKKLTITDYNLIITNHNLIITDYDYIKAKL